MLKAVGMPDNKISMHLQKNGTLQKKQEVKIYETSEKRLCVSVRSHIDILHPSFAATAPATTSQTETNFID